MESTAADAGDMADGVSEKRPRASPFAAPHARRRLNSPFLYSERKLVASPQKQTPHSARPTSRLSTDEAFLGADCDGLGADFRLDEIADQQSASSAAGSASSAAANVPSAAPQHDDCDGLGADFVDETQYLEEGATPQSVEESFRHDTPLGANDPPNDVEDSAAAGSASSAAANAPSAAPQHENPAAGYAQDSFISQAAEQNFYAALEERRKLQQAGAPRDPMEKHIATEHISGWTIAPGYRGERDYLVTVNRMPYLYTVKQLMVDILCLTRQKQPRRMVGREEVGYKKRCVHAHVAYRTAQPHRWKLIKAQLDKRIQKWADDNPEPAPEADENDAGQPAKLRGLFPWAADEDNDFKISADWKPLALGDGVGYLLKPSYKKPALSLGLLCRYDEESQPAVSLHKIADTESYEKSDAFCARELLTLIQLKGWTQFDDVCQHASEDPRIVDWMASCGSKWKREVYAMLELNEELTQGDTDLLELLREPCKDPPKNTKAPTSKRPFGSPCGCTYDECWEKAIRLQGYHAEQFMEDIVEWGALGRTRGNWLFVTGGPGTGKTYTLIEPLKMILDDYAFLAPSSTSGSHHQEALAENPVKKCFVFDETTSAILACVMGDGLETPGWVKRLLEFCTSSRLTLNLPKNRFYKRRVFRDRAPILSTGTVNREIELRLKGLEIELENLAIDMDGQVPNTPEYVQSKRAMLAKKKEMNDLELQQLALREEQIKNDYETANDLSTMMGTDFGETDNEPAQLENAASPYIQIPQQGGPNANPNIMPVAPANLVVMPAAPANFNNVPAAPANFNNVPAAPAPVQPYARIIPRAQPYARPVQQAPVHPAPAVQAPVLPAPAAQQVQESANLDIVNAVPAVQQGVSEVINLGGDNEVNQAGAAVQDQAEAAAQPLILPPMIPMLNSGMLPGVFANPQQPWQNPNIDWETIFAEEDEARVVTANDRRGLIPVIRRGEVPGDSRMLHRLYRLRAASMLWRVFEANFDGSARISDQIRGVCATIVMRHVNGWEISQGQRTFFNNGVRRAMEIEQETLDAPFLEYTCPVLDDEPVILERI
eukprot:g20015.t1